ncbi:MAG: hypothetical protein WC175_01805 [Candidatus Dojkabacteria bacterium]|jgi:hypothetical protein
MIWILGKNNQEALNFIKEQKLEGRAKGLTDQYKGRGLERESTIVLIEGYQESEIFKDTDSWNHLYRTCKIFLFLEKEGVGYLVRLLLEEDKTIFCKSGEVYRRREK